MPLDAKPKATLCSHLDRPEKAKGRCASCYNSWLKAEKAATAVANDQVRIEGNDEVDLRWQPAIPKGLDLEDDDVAKKEFERILWGWIFEGEKLATRPDEIEPKDWIKLKEVTASKAMKAATILGRKFIVEKKEVITPQRIPVAGAEDAVAGWAEVAALSMNHKNKDLEDGDDYDA
jgi:hypothetical protein